MGPERLSHLPNADPVHPRPCSSGSGCGARDLIESATGRAVDALGAPTVVVHLPFRWQQLRRRLRRPGGRTRESDSGIAVAVENMSAGAPIASSVRRRSVKRPARAGTAGPSRPFSKSIDPTDEGYANYVGPIAPAARMDALAMFERMASMKHPPHRRGRRAHDEHHSGRWQQPCSGSAGGLRPVISTGSRPGHDQQAHKPERTALARSSFARTHLRHPTRRGSAIGGRSARNGRRPDATHPRMRPTHGRTRSDPEEARSGRRCPPVC